GTRGPPPSAAPPELAAEVPACEGADGTKLELAETVLPSDCLGFSDYTLTSGTNEAYIGTLIEGCGTDQSERRADIYAYPAVAPVYSYTYPDSEEVLFPPKVEISGSVGSGVFAWQGLFRRTMSEGWSMTLIDVLNQNRFAAIVDLEHSYFIASFSDPYLLWTSTGQSELGRLTVYDVSTLPPLARPVNAVAVHTGSVAATFSWTLPIPDADGDGLDDVLLDGTIGENYFTGFLSHEDILTDQGFLNASLITERPDISTGAPDWDGDGIADIALYNPHWIGARIEIYNHRAEQIAAFYREDLPDNYPQEDPYFGDRLHTVTGFLGEGEDALAFLDFSDNGPKVRILEPGSCGSVSLAETAYFFPAADAGGSSAYITNEIIGFPFYPEGGPNGILLYHP
ncbi:MAG TPA: hypothetical protein PLA94_26180, partial [Myxococcota bacterium]|nr:hypothetical protein [Myxococcota bacterium]